MNDVQHRGETFEVERHGRPVARIGPTEQAAHRRVSWKKALALLNAGPSADADFATDLQELRQQVELPPEDPWARWLACTPVCGRTWPQLANWAAFGATRSFSMRWPIRLIRSTRNKSNGPAADLTPKSFDPARVNALLREFAHDRTLVDDSR